MRRIWIAALALLLLVLVAAPWAVRWLTLHQGGRQPRTVARPDLSAVEVAAPSLTGYQDKPVPAPRGIILIDALHDNLFDPADLSLLQERLSARGQRLETLDLEEELEPRLRYAKALVVISPLADWAAGEVDQVTQFVRRGGRLLLIADATHYAAETDDWGFLIGLDHDAPHLNSLSAPFGLLFQPDYLYNMAENANNYRNVRLRDFAESALTEGIEELVFFGTRSIRSQGPGLVLAGAGTRSSADDRVERPAVAALAGNGQVLALGDSTFLSEPYSGIAGNDRFVSQIADFLSRAEREYALDEFPHFFGDRVDLVYTSDPLLDSDLIPGGGGLQSLFAEAGKVLTVEASEDASNDTLFLGLYGEAGEVEQVLARAQITLTLPPEAGTEIEPWPEVTPTLTATEELTPRIEIESLGLMVPEGTALILRTLEGERRILVVLADTVTGLQAAVQRLLDGDLEGCIVRESDDALALCSTGELEEGEGTGGWPEAVPEEEGEEPWGGVGGSAPAGAPAGTAASAPLPSRTRKPGQVLWRGDLHLHTTCSDGANTYEEMVGKAVELGLDFIAITDHRNWGGRTPDEAAAYARCVDGVIAQCTAETRLLCIPGMELMVRGSELVHFLFLGLQTRPQEWPAGLAAQVSEIHRLGGLAIAAHPYREGASYTEEELLGSGFDTMECARGTEEQNQAQWALAARHGLPCVYVSDAHNQGALGRRATVCSVPIYSLADLKAALIGDLCEMSR